MTWLGAPLFFWAQKFFAVHVRSFCSNKKLLRKCLWHTNYPTSLITSDVFAKHNFCSLLVHMGSLTALRDTFVCFWAQIRKSSRAWCSFDYMMLGFHENLTFQKAIFHSICLRWTNFNETSLMSGITLTLFFASVSESSSRLFWWLFNVFLSHSVLLYFYQPWTEFILVSHVLSTPMNIFHCWRVR